MSPRQLVLALALLAPAPPALGQIRPPVVTGVNPPAVPSGATTAVSIDGTGLDRASGLVWDDPHSGPIKWTLSASRGSRVEATVSVPADTPPGAHAFRVVSPRGLSNAGRIVVSRPGPVVAEVEPNDGFRNPQAVAAPGTVAGAIADGSDVDVYAVNVRDGETLVAEVLAARAGSTLDPVVTVFSPEGRELASADDVFGRDAAVSVRVRRGGRYLVQVVDANGRDRDGAVENTLKDKRTYRLSVGALPLITAVDPPGLRRGESTRLRLVGANVPPAAVLSPPAEAPAGDLPFQVGGSNGVVLRVGDAPEVRAVEPDDDADGAAVVTIPAAINGRFDRKAGGDVDHFRLKPADGRAGDYTITAYAARIGSPADPVVTALADDGRVLAEDDDRLGRDARVERRVEPGGLLLSLREYHGRGGDRFLYRVEIEASPAVRLVVDPGSRTVPRRGRVALPIEVERRGSGPLTVRPGPLPPGVHAEPITIPAGSTRGLLILSADETAMPTAFPFRPSVADAPGPVEWKTVVPRDSLPASALPTGGDVAHFSVAEQATLGVELEPGVLDVTPGGEARLTIRLDRRGKEANGPVKVGLRPVDGDASGLDLKVEETLAAGVNERVVPVKWKPGTTPGPSRLVATARFDGEPEARGIASGVVRVSPRPAGK